MSVTIESTQVIENTHKILNQANLPDRHSYFQIEKFAIGKEPTIQGKLWQIVRELDARIETFDSYQKQIEDAEDNLELMDIGIERANRALREEAQEKSTFTDLNIQEIEINIKKQKREKEALIKATQKVKHKLKCLIEEMAYLSVGFDKLVKKHGDLKPLDDFEVQQELWNEKYLEEFNLRVILKIPMDTEFVKSIMCLNDDAPVKKHMTAIMKDIQNQMISTKNEMINKKEGE